MTMIKTNESGRSMIEMLGVLAIIGVLSVGGIAGYSKAMNKFKTNKVADNVSMLVANIKTMYAQQNTYKDLTSAVAVTLGVVPDELVVKDDNGNFSRLSNSFNGAVDIHAAESTSDGDNRAFVITFSNLSREACITLATNDWGSGYSSGLIAIRASGTSQAKVDEVKDGEGNVTTQGKDAESSALDKIHIGDDGTAVTGSGSNGKAIATPGGKNLSVPMSVTDAATACACPKGNFCTVMWKYY